MLKQLDKFLLKEVKNMENKKINDVVVEFESFEDIEEIVTADNKGSFGCCNS